MTTRTRSAIAAAIAAGAVATAALTLVAPGTAVASATESVPVSFDVVTSNRSGVPCAAAPVERRVTVRGHLTGPADEMRDGLDGALYSHGNGYGEFFYRWTGDREYDFVDDMADRGHVSVTIDRLGYGASDKPDGNDVCFGTEADVLHQIVQQLRDGSYQGDRTPSFGRVALLGHSASGLIAEQEAAAFHDVDALGVLSSGALTASALVLQRTGEMQLRCLTAGDGYAALEASDAQFRADHLHNIDRAIADAVTDRRSEDACAGTRNAGQAVAANPVRNNTITVPVLLLVGKDDKFFAMNPPAQAATYSRSRKVTLVELADTGHALAFGRTAPRFRDEVHGWLDANGF